MDIGLLCDFAYSVAVEGRNSEERDSFDRWLNETPEETAERIEKEKADARAERMKFAGGFAQVIAG